MHKLRGVAASHQAKAAAPESVEQLDADFEKAVARSLSDSAAHRKRRLKAASKVPARTPVLVLAFERNPDVVAEVLLRAMGACERCKQKAPFLRRKDNTPYLEVHHIQQLADGGEDSVENATALCPNCHRDFHYGMGEA
jgi:5-methylcytosine-specific restriction protein A